MPLKAGIRIKSKQKGEEEKSNTLRKGPTTFGKNLFAVSSCVMKRFDGKTRKAGEALAWCGAKLMLLLPRSVEHVGDHVKGRCVHNYNVERSL